MHHRLQYGNLSLKKMMSHWFFWPKVSAETWCHVTLTNGKIGVRIILNGPLTFVKIIFKKKLGQVITKIIFLKNFFFSKLERFPWRSGHVMDGPRRCGSIRKGYPGVGSTWVRAPRGLVSSGKGIHGIGPWRYGFIGKGYPEVRFHWKRVLRGRVS